MQSSKQQATGRQPSRTPSPLTVPLFTGMAVLAGAMFALQPLLQGHVPWRADGLLHLHRLAQLDRALRHGLLYPRWLPDLSFGYGFPLFHYYAPLSYYLSWPWQQLGLSTAAALRVGYALALLALALGAYLWTRDLFGAAAGLVAAFAAIYAPYVLYNTHHRGVLPEVWGLAWLAFTFFTLHRLARRPTAKMLFLSVLFYAALLLTHNILALLGTPLLFAYALFLTDPAPGRNLDDTKLAIPPRLRASVADRFRRQWPLLLALALGLGLSAFFWLPAFFEKELVQINKLYDSANFFYGNNFLAYSELYAWPRPADPAQVNPAIPLGLGIPQLLLAAIASVTALVPERTSLSRATYAHHIALALVFLLLVAMALPLSQPLWDWLPLLRFVQFPWRFLGPASLLLAVLSGAVVARLPGPRWLWPPLTFLILAVSALPWLFPATFPATPNPTPLDTFRFEMESGALGTTSAGDYLPVQVEEVPSPDTLLPFYEAAASATLDTFPIPPRLDPTTLPDGGRIISYAQQMTEATLTLETPAPFTARFYQFYFPGWQAELNGRSHPLTAIAPSGLITTDVPAGHHQLRLYFNATLLRRVAELLSLASAIALAAITIWLHRHPMPKTHSQFTIHNSPFPIPNSEEARQAGDDVSTKDNTFTPPAASLPISNLQSLISITFIALALFATKTLYLDQTDSIFRRARFNGQQVSGVDVPLQVNFSEQLALLGYDLPASTVAADALLDLDLYWRAVQPLDTEYSVAVHLVDEQGRRYGQSDNFHPAAFPTTRWQTTEYARDRHRLEIWPGAPPGVYTVQVQVYARKNGRLLAIHNDAGQPTGVTYPLAQIQVTRPDAYPAPTELALSHVLETDAGGAVRVVGVDAVPAAIQTGDLLRFTLFWQATAVPASDYHARLRLVSSDGKAVAEDLWAPGRSDHPTSAWQAGELVRDGRSFLIPAVHEDDLTRPIVAGDYFLKLDLLNGDGEPVGKTADLGALTITTPERTFDLPPRAVSLDATFGGRATLRGYTLSTTTPTPGEPLQLELVWQANAPMSAGYTTFVHLAGPNGAIVAQRDQIPGNGARPTTGWLPGEVVVDTAVLHLPPDAPAGVYRLRIGFYDPITGERLPIETKNEGSNGALLLPTSLQVTESGS